MQHLGLSRLSSPLNSLHSLAALLRCQLLLHNPFQRTPVCRSPSTDLTTAHHTRP